MCEQILVIDDDLVIRKSFMLALEDANYNVDVAESGEAGLEKMSTTDYNLIFLDLKMPGINGVETLMILRNKGYKMPVYIVTAFHKEFFEELKTAMNKGMEFELLRKPIGNKQIVILTKCILNQHRNSQEVCSV